MEMKQRTWIYYKENIYKRDTILVQLYTYISIPTTLASLMEESTSRIDTQLDIYKCSLSFSLSLFSLSSQGEKNARAKMER